MTKPKITIAIPAYNSAKTIEASIDSAKMQAYPHKEVLVLDDGSTDNTVEIAEKCGCRVIKNEKNKGIGYCLKKLMGNAEGKYIVYLCSDDIFADNMVANDIVRQFDVGDSDIGVLSRYYYEFSGHFLNVIGVFRDKNILTSSVNPSGMAFRIQDKDIDYTNSVFVEMPYIVSQYLKRWRWSMIEYDTIAVRIHPGGNTGTKKEYYKGSAVENWYNIIGAVVPYYPQFIQLRNRSTFKMVIREIKSMVRIKPDCVKDPAFWFYASIAVIFPGCILRQLTKLYRFFNTYNIKDIIRRPE